MSAQRHIVKQQVLELHLSSMADAQQLQTEVSRIYRQRIVPILDQYCSELSDPDRIHRIDSLELNLGTVRPEHLEEDLVAHVSTQLRILLAEHITADERKAEGSGADRKTTSQLELFSVFAQTGSVPWWADSSQPHLLDNCLQYLLHNAPGPFRGLLRELAQGQTYRQRIVRHFDDRLLADLAAVLTPSLDVSAFAHMVRDLVLILQSTTSGAAQRQTQLRHLVWSAIMQQVSLRGEKETAWPPFLYTVLIRVARELGVTYTALLSSMYQVVRKNRERFQSPIDDITETLYTELLGATTTGLANVIRETPHPIPSFRDRFFTERKAESSFPQKRESSNSPLAGIERLDARLRGHDGPEKLPLQKIRENHEEGETPTLVSLLRALAMRLPSPNRAQMLVALDRLEHGAADGDVFSDLTRLLRSETVEQGLPVTLHQRWRATIERIAVSGFAQDKVLKLTELLQHVGQEGRSPRHEDKVASLDLTFSDADELYIDNAGLAILHPFLRHFFERLDLLEDKQFKDVAARQRAVGLLQYAVSEDPSSPEYLLPLNKVLCGMELDEVFDFGPPVTEAEAEECTNLLTAVIANAPILKNMSVNGLRGTFLLRRGVLSSRDGAWLLRVERETYDVVLDRFPWTLQWVKLPWMDTPLRVEW